MEVNSFSNCSKICCACLKHIVDESPVIYLYKPVKRHFILHKLAVLMPELLNDIMFPNPLICKDCAAEVESAFAFKLHYLRHGITAVGAGFVGLSITIRYSSDDPTGDGEPTYIIAPLEDTGTPTVAGRANMEHYQAGSSSGGFYYHASQNSHLENPSESSEEDN